MAFITAFCQQDVVAKMTVKRLSSSKVLSWLFKGKFIVMLKRNSQNLILNISRSACLTLPDPIFTLLLESPETLQANDDNFTSHKVC